MTTRASDLDPSELREIIRKIIQEKVRTLPHDGEYSPFFPDLDLYIDYANSQPAFDLLISERRTMRFSVNTWLRVKASFRQISEKLNVNPPFSLRENFVLTVCLCPCRQADGRGSRH